MSKGLKIFGAVVGVLALIIGLIYINTAVYPFQSKHPNYADVEQAFAKLQFPADWQEISSSENRGIAGRQCDPFDSSGCFSKSKTFKLTGIAEAKQSAKKMLTQSGCGEVGEEETYEGNSNLSPKTLVQVSCQNNNGVKIGVSVSQQRGEASVVASTY